ncbi:MAG: hypothetical protein R3183_13120 [Oleiphilaceae bacterium]|nr:hypothetical protein [Oleiphilaceae bacterium]
MKFIYRLLMIAVMAMAVVACSDSSAEKAGERIDETLTDVENKVEDLCEQAKEGMKLENQEC